MDELIKVEFNLNTYPARKLTLAIKKSDLIKMLLGINKPISAHILDEVTENISASDDIMTPIRVDKWIYTTSNGTYTIDEKYYYDYYRPVNSNSFSSNWTD